MLTLDNLEILSYGAGTPSTTLVGMACENAMRGYHVWPEVPIYDAVIFCDLHAEPSWVYRQAAFAADLCRRASIPFYKLDVDLYGDYLNRFGKARVSSIPFWTLGKDGKKGRMPRQCTVDYKIKMIERFVRYDLLCYRPRERTLSVDKHAHRLHMGIMAEEARRAKESKAILFENKYPLVAMGWTRSDCYAYNREVWGIETKASCCVFCPFHTGYFYQHIREHDPACYACACQVDELIERYQAHPPLKSQLFISKTHKRLRDLSDADCGDVQTFLYKGSPVWTGF